jgi:glycerophosphoryl diester phosphodiesterase
MKDTIKLENKGHALMIAHRGVCGLETENTHAAFVAAGNRSYYGIEADVHKTADGKFVIMHDDNTLRMTGDDIQIGKVSYETLRRLQLRQKDGRLGRTDLRIPSMEEYLEICKYYGKKAILELKDEFSAEDIGEICRIAESLEYMDHIVFISFKLNNLLLLKEKYPKQVVQYLVMHEIDDALIQELADRDMGLDAYQEMFTEQVLRKCREKGVETNAWTVNDPEMAQKLIDWGIDYLTSNILE